MKYILSLLFIGVFSSYLQAVDNLRLPDIRSIGLGGNGVTQSLLFNPSLIIFKEHKTIHMEYMNCYMLKELGTVSGYFLYPNRVLPAGVHLSAFGYDKYREIMIRSMAGKRLGERWTLGIGIQYSFLQAEILEEPGKRLSTDIGATFSPVDNLLVGLLIMNLPSISFGNKDIDSNDFKSYLLQIGFQWKIINSMLIIGSLGTSNEHSIEGNIGIEYNAFDSFRIRAGVQSSPLLPSLGLGYDFFRFTVDASLRYHPVLGMSTGVGLSFSF